MLIRMTIFIFVLVNSFSSFAGTKPFKKQVFAVGVGQVEMKYEYVGEPISRPDLFTISVKCQGTNKWHKVVEYEMCSIEEHKYDAKEKAINIKYTNGRVDPKTGQSFCDQSDQVQFVLTDVCKKPAAPVKKKTGALESDSSGSVAETAR